ncbi:unnamed protein product [Paramecium sonneborni]|uniref:Uncharacterized protein n=1 Tax=Paramecium sonneborni TaxID=65129 RepID=A0A8S1KSX1_9CILI|nr:unnamed protein product [Paramecium sonneborni]
MQQLFLIRLQKIRVFGFCFGQCFDFTDCSILGKDNYSESSHQCIFEGTYCVKMLKCNDKIGCTNKNQNGKHCFWITGTLRNCTNVTKCEPRGS